MAPYTPCETNLINENVKKPRIKKTLKNYSSNIGTFGAELKWFNIILLSIIHITFFYNLNKFPWLSKGKLILFHTIVGVTGALGVTAGAHRLWCHRAYKAKVQLRILLMLFYCIMGHNPLFNWIRDHRVHHKYTDTDADPHNSKRGFFFAHMGWLFMKKHPDVISKGKEVDMSDLWEDPVIRFHQKYYVILVLLLGFIIPSMIPPLCWGDDWYWSIMTTWFGRYCLQLHCTWLVNSAAHIFGTKPFDRSISPTENLTVSIITCGEGWHNYHHVFPWDYKAAELGKYSVNVTTFWIDFFAKLGWAYNLRTPSPALVKMAILKNGDGTHPVYGYKEIPESFEKKFDYQKN